MSSNTRKIILLVEDVVLQQARMLTHLSEILEHEGDVQVVAVPDAYHALSVLEDNAWWVIKLIILDHDMPHGDGPEFLKSIHKDSHYAKIPVITFSGIPVNNKHLMGLGATHEFQKDDVINGAADNIIMEIVNA